MPPRQYRWVYLSGGWVAVFTLFPAFWIPTPSKQATVKLSWQLCREAWHHLIITIKHIRQYKMICRFLIAYWLYIDGVGTVIVMAIDYGLSLGFAADSLIKALLITQLIGFPCAYLWGKIARRYPVRHCILVAIVAYLTIVCAGGLMQTVTDFYLLACAVGIFQGGIQALSRSYYASFIPVGEEAQFFGFYNLIDRFAAILVAIINGGCRIIVATLFIAAAATAHQIQEVSLIATRWSMVSIGLLFIGGGLVFYSMKYIKPEPPPSSQPYNNNNKGNE